MNPEFRMSRMLYASILEDLQRPHTFAFERVGFLYCRTASKGNILIGSEYEPVLDRDYIPDEFVGAKINGDSIRRVMERILNSGESVLHTHMHEFPGAPAFSYVDKENLHRLMPSFCGVNPEGRHGALLLSPDGVRCSVWIPAIQELVDSAGVTVVGFPTSFSQG